MVASCWTFIDTDLQHSRTPGPPSGLPIPGNFYRLPCLWSALGISQRYVCTVMKRNSKFTVVMLPAIQNWIRMCNN
jgi:hypothetical protein